MFTVYKFKLFYSVSDDEVQERYVVAESSDSAWKKINAHFEDLSAKGFMKPICIIDPTVEIDYVIY